MSHFSDNVFEIIKAVPVGKVVSYGQVAAYAGLPRSAREVGRLLYMSSGKTALPWWRVINREGNLTIRGNRFADRQMQKRLLQDEGITVTTDFRVNMKQYRFIADEKFLAKFQLPKDYIKQIYIKYGL